MKKGYDKCPSCGQPKTQRASLCRACKRNDKDNCQCGRLKTKSASLCRACKDKDRHKDDCPSCGQPKDTRASLCRACRNKELTNKPCNGCGVVYDINEYSIRPDGRGGHKRRSRCKKCECEDSKNRRINWTDEERKKVARKKKEYGQNNKDKARRWGMRASWKKMGFDPDYIEQYVNEQPQVCQICGAKSNGKYRRMYIDHCHNTNQLRGMLCANCNFGLGNFMDDVDTLKKAIEYLNKYKNLPPNPQEHL